MRGPSHATGGLDGSILSTHIHITSAALFCLLTLISVWFLALKCHSGRHWRVIELSKYRQSTPTYVSRL